MSRSPGKQTSITAGSSVACLKTTDNGAGVLCLPPLKKMPRALRHALRDTSEPYPRNARHIGRSAHAPEFGLQKNAIEEPGQPSSACSKMPSLIANVWSVSGWLWTAPVPADPDRRQNGRGFDLWEITPRTSGRDGVQTFISTSLLVGPAPGDPVVMGLDHAFRARPAICRPNP